MRQSLRQILPLEGTHPDPHRYGDNGEEGHMLRRMVDASSSNSPLSRTPVKATSKTRNFSSSQVFPSALWELCLSCRQFIESNVALNLLSNKSDGRGARGGGVKATPLATSTKKSTHKRTGLDVKTGDEPLPRFALHMK